MGKMMLLVGILFLFNEFIFYLPPKKVCFSSL